jgi:hypothetical protein
MVSGSDFALSTNNRDRFGGGSPMRPQILHLPFACLPAPGNAPREFGSANGKLARICFLV